MPFDSSSLNHYPLEPGVYMMRDAKGKVLYIGKAKQLAYRLKQYFQKGGDGRAMIPHLTSQVEKIDTIVTLTEKEALILENQLIKDHKPKYNVLLKDDKTFISLMLSNHEWPRLSIIRYKGKPIEKGVYFGPYTNATAAREAMDVLNRTYQLRQCSDHELISRKRPCMLYDMKRCMAPCMNRCTQSDYKDSVQKVKKFLKGYDDSLIKKMRKELETASSLMEYEKAQEIYSSLKLIEPISEHHKFILNKKTPDLDVIGYYEQRGMSIVTILSIRDHKLSHSENHTFVEPLETKEEILERFILQFYGTKIHPPGILLTPFDLDQVAALEEILLHSRKVQISAPKIGDKKALIDMAIKNAEIAFEHHLNKKSENVDTLLRLEELLKLSHFPSQIECFDTSNMSLKDAVASMVTYIDGVKCKKKYRLFRIKNLEKTDDYSAMEEVLLRRYQKEKNEDNLPDLIVIDGGKGQLGIAEKVLKRLNIASCDVIALTKEDSRHDKGLRKERIFVMGQSDPIELPVTSRELFLLQTIRDEAHRTAITYHRKARSKRLIKSALDDIHGIGKVKKTRLLKTFGSMKAILEASDQMLLEVQGIHAKDVAAIRTYAKELKNKNSG